MKKQLGPSLFDIIEEDIAKEAVSEGRECRHPIMRPSETIWHKERFPRWTMTCTICGYIRGRFPGEPNDREIVWDRTNEAI